MCMYAIIPHLFSIIPYFITIMYFLYGVAMSMYMLNVNKICMVKYEPSVCNYTMISINALHIPCLLQVVDDEVVNSRDGVSSNGVSVRESR